MSYGPVPWDSPGEVVAFFGKAQGMFRSDALLVDLGDLLAWRVGHDGFLRTAMAAHSRPGYALRRAGAERGTAAQSQVRPAGQPWGANASDAALETVRFRGRPRAERG
jgi:hypothetical protein